jgi:FKBP-type peptidyl-prolyl cis-trans isomerase SlyD
MQVKKDSVVAMDYKLTLDSGSVIDSSANQKKPLVFLMGHNQLFSGLENSLLGMKIGDKKSVVIPPKKGYGVRDEKLVQTVPRSQLPSDIALYEGQILTGKNDKGQKIEVTVKKFDENQVELDLNHPLAGMYLNFNVEIKNVREATEEEIEHGHVH